MYAYLLLCFSVIFSYAGQAFRHRVFFTCLFFVLCSLLLGLRGTSVGIDTSEYYWIFFLANERSSHPYINDGLEPLFVLSNQVFGAAGLSAQHYVFFVSVFVVGSFSYLFHKYSHYYFLSWLCFFGNGTFFQLHNTMRQSIAIAILALSVPFIVKRKPLLFSVLLILASGFHYSSITFLFFYIIYWFRFRLAFVFLLWVGSLLFVFNSTLFIYVFNFFSGWIPEVYSGYLKDSRLLSMGGQGLGLKLILLQFIALAMMWLIKAKYIGRFGRFFIVAGFFAIVVTNVFSHVGILNRVTQYFTMFLPVSVSLIPLIFCKRDRGVVAFGLALCFFALFVRSLFTDPHGIFPYTSVIWGA